MKLGRSLLFTLGVCFASPSLSFGLTLDFDTLSDSDAVTTQFAGLGVVFTHALVFSAGISLNEFESPPHSGTNVVFDAGGPIVVSFPTTAFLSIGGFFTYTVPLTLTAFSTTDPNDPSAVVLGSVSSAFSSNLALSGDVGSSPNEFLHLSGLGLIRSVRMTGDSAGSSFTLDDVQGTPTTAPVPEPGTLLLVSSALGVLVSFRKLP